MAVSFDSDAFASVVLSAKAVFPCKNRLITGAFGKMASSLNLGLGSCARERKGPQSQAKIGSGLEKLVG